MTRFLALSVFFAACAPSTFEGSASTCLSSPADPVTLEDGSELWTLDGTIESFDADVSCDTAGAARGAAGMTLRTEDGQLHTVGWSLLVGEDDVTPALRLVEVGDAVVVNFVRTNDWGQDHGLAITDDAGVVLALEEGWSTDFDRLGTDNPLAGLSVERGDATGPRKADQCGTRRGYELSFEADTELTLGPNHSGNITDGDHMLVVQNAGSWGFVGQVNCTDTWGPTAWAAWRVPPFTM
ncbi:MAG: hypothetical protein EP330_31140 [Deltaproteobacteria bacterium]|nr:MAG: hypothetical protein EP330_31140 [Deltaproteobacteria bacterium]